MLYRGGTPQQIAVVPVENKFNIELSSVSHIKEKGKLKNALIGERKSKKI